MVFSKKDPAYRSGMRGGEEPGAADASATAAEEPSADMEVGHVVAQHVHTDENGHHHLNLTSLAEHMQKHGGKHEQ